MSRGTFLIFNLLLIGVLYTLTSFTGSKALAVTYTVTYFSIPYILLNFTMAAFCLVRWFMTRDFEVANTGITFLHAIWISTLFTFIAYEVTSVDVVDKAREYLHQHSQSDAGQNDNENSPSPSPSRSPSSDDR